MDGSGCERPERNATRIVCFAFHDFLGGCYTHGSLKRHAEEVRCMEELVQVGERILLCQDLSRSYLLRMKPGATFSTHQGSFRHDDIIGRRPGEWIRSHIGRLMLILRPTTHDLMMKVRRKTNIVYPKDAAQILLRLGIIPGSRVLEVGTGSGALTIALARAVGSAGRIYTYDVREDHLERARQNVSDALLSDRVEFALRGPGDPFAQTGVEAVILDIPQPWDEIEALRETLMLGGRLASLNPTYNQIERLATELHHHGYALIEAEEILFRRILARAGKTRPEQRMVGHTEFLVYAARTGRLPPARGKEADAAEAEESVPEELADTIELVVSSGEAEVQDGDVEAVLPAEALPLPKLAAGGAETSGLCGGLGAGLAGGSAGKAPADLSVSGAVETEFKAGQPLSGALEASKEEAP